MILSGIILSGMILTLSTGNIIDLPTMLQSRQRREQMQLMKMEKKRRMEPK